ncbi:MAG: hypothetical protein ACI8RD_014918 [Bacillariaceae sp.]|jgi:hypothetical protein
MAVRVVDRWLCLDKGSARLEIVGGQRNFGFHSIFWCVGDGPVIVMLK